MKKGAIKLLRAKIKRDKGKQRSLRNLLLRPAFQIRYGVYFVVLGLISAIGVQWILYRQIRDSIIEFYTSKSGRNVLDWLDPTITTMQGSHFLYLAGFSLICFATGIYLTHRVAGPALAIRRHIKELQEGNYKVRLGLRSNDEFHDIAVELNKLAEILQKQQPAKNFEEKSEKNVA